MLDQLQEGFGKVIKTLKGEGKITDKNIRETTREIRRVLLKADVNYKVAKKFTNRVKEKAVGAKVTKSLSPGQVFIKIINDELTNLLGNKSYNLKTASTPPTVIMLAGLQGCGKTTLAAKLAKHYANKGHNPLLVPVDVHRPAAVQQLEKLSQQIEMPVYSGKSRVKSRVKASVKHARKNNRDLIIIDTAGRLHIDQDMMDELHTINKAVDPENIIFVADGLTGQDAVNTAAKFDEEIDYDAIVLTKMDSDTRGGAALSIVETTNKPIAFLSVGEKPDDLEVFHPSRVADRILGKGDVVSLVEKVQDAVDEEEARKLEEKIRKQEFTLEDYLSQIRQMKNLGPLENVIDMLPGNLKSQLKGQQVDEDQITKIEAIILSMTPEERYKPSIIKRSRKRRIARGSGTSVKDVNILLKQYRQLKKMTQKLGSMKFPKKLSSLGLGF